MKSNPVNQIFILLSLCLYSYATNVSAQAQEACDAYNGEMNSFVNSFFDSKCLDREGESRCECLAEEKSSNQFLESMKSQENIQNYQAQQRTKKTKHFFEVYNEMFLGSAFQREILYGKDVDKNNGQVEKVVGCTASEMAKKIDKKIKHHIDIKKELEEEALENKISELNDCKKTRNDCEWLQEQVKQTELNYKKKKSEEYDQICKQINANNKKTSAQIHLETARNWYLSTSLPDEEIQKKIKKIDCLLIQVDGVGTVPEDYRTKGCREITGEWSSVDRLVPIKSAQILVQFQPQIPTSNIDNNSDVILPLPQKNITVVSTTPVCHRSTMEVQIFMEDFDNEKIAYLKNEGTSTQKNKDPQLSDCGGDEICKSFDEINILALKAKEQSFKYSPKNCISYPEFLMKKGIPGDEFMKELANTPDDRVGELLKIPKIITSESSKQRLHFLKSNPLVAQLVLDDGKRIKLANDLKKMALTNSKKSKAQKLDSYLSFVKGPVKDLINQDNFKSSQKFLCEQMINSYTAIQISAELPPVKEDPAKFPLMAAVQSCELSLDRITSVTESVGDLELNDLFRTVDGDTPEKSDEEKFKQMNQENCQKYPAFSDSKCNGVQDEACREKFLASSDMKDEQDVLNKQGTSRQLNETNFNRAAAYSRDADQDTVYKRAWDKKIGNRLSKNVIPYKGQKEEFIKSQAEDKSKVAAAMPEIKQPDYTKGTLPQNTNTAVTKNNIESNIQKTQTPNPGQVLPSYSDTPVTFLPEKLATSKDVRSSLPDFEKLPQEDKIAGLNQVKNYLDNSKDNFETADLQRKIEDTNKLLDAELKEQKANINKYSSFDYKTPNFNNKTNQATEGNGVLSPSGDNSGSSSAACGNIANSSKGQNAVNDALNNIDQNKLSAQPQTKKEVIIRSGVVSEAEFKGKIEISQELIASSEEQFKVLSTDAKALESYLQTQLMNQDIGEGRIISILDPSSKIPAQNLIFRVVIENGRYVVQSLPVTVKVERNSTLEGLKLNLKSIN
jgi:hypothetical protein